MTDLYDAQIQAIRQYTGISQTWMREWSDGIDDVSKEISPFFGRYTSASRQEDYRNIKFYNAPASATITKPVHGAIEYCIKQIVNSIMIGGIKWDYKEIFKLKDWPADDCDCKSMLYAALLEWENVIYRETPTVDDPEVNQKIVEQFGENVNEFLGSWRQYLLDEVISNLKMIGEDTDEIVEEIRSRLSQQDKSLGGRVEEYEPEKFRFNVTEDVRLEFKQSVFAPNLSKIGIDPKEDPEKYTKLAQAKKREVLQDVFSSVCAFLNTDGGEIYIGIHDATRNIVGLSDDRNSAEFTKKNLEYAKFQDTFMGKISALLKNNIKNLRDEYVSGMKFIPYTEGIDIFCIPCEKIMDPAQPVLLKKVEFDKNGNKIGEHDVLYKRVHDHDEQIESHVGVYHFYAQRFPKYQKMIGENSIEDKNE